MKLRIEVELDDGSLVKIERVVAEPTTCLGMAHTAALELKAMADSIWQELMLL